MQDHKLTIHQIGGGNFEDSKLACTRNVLNKGRLSLFVGAMVAVLFVFDTEDGDTIYYEF